jgi:tRNA threonylcarbamoyl adenosine modification protein (Sua5/YciO/YrdC/YwlC family)
MLCYKNVKREILCAFHIENLQRKMVTKRIYWGDASSIELVRAVLQKDELVVGTSDTVVGFLAVTTEKSKKLLDETKGRQDKPYIILIESRDKLNLFVDIQESARVNDLLMACWPGPLTVIFKAKNDLSFYLKSPEGTIAIRVPAHAGLQKLLAFFPGLFSTSANISGQPVPETVEAIDPEILKQVAYVIDDSPERRAGDVQKKAPSTIIDCTGPEIKVIREGAYSIAKLRTYV